MSLDFEVVEHGEDFVILALRGELSEQFWTKRIRHVLEEHYVDDGVRVIRADLSAVRFMDNHGVATLLALYKESLARGKRFVVEDAVGQPREKLKVAGVLRILEGGT
jgi:anti-anti-sigma factor